MSLKFSICFAAFSLFHLQAQSTTASPLLNATTGYNLQTPQQTAAPGQVLVLSITGIKAIFAQPIMGVIADNDFPTNIGGISVDLVQDNPPSVTPVRLRGIQQGYCFAISICNTVTGITLQVPFTLAADFTSTPRLRVSEGGQVVGVVLLRPVTDNVHVLNTCDYTLIAVGGADSVPQDICASAAFSGRKLNSLYNISHAGDGIAAYAYGLGALANDGTDGSLKQQFLVSFDFRPNASPSRAVPGYGGAMPPQYAGYVGGAYQVNFVIPAIPANLPACDGVVITSNLTVTITGPNSFDGVALCVAR